MKDDLKQRAAARYEQELRKGERFWPDSIYKDLLASLGIFVLLVLLATFVGIDPQPKADPSDTSYLPRLKPLRFHQQEVLAGGFIGEIFSRNLARYFNEVGASILLWVIRRERASPAASPGCDDVGIGVKVTFGAPLADRPMQACGHRPAA